MSQTPGIGLLSLSMRGSRGMAQTFLLGLARGERPGASLRRWPLHWRPW
jgi:hypothetical protein